MELHFNDVILLMKLALTDVALLSNLWIQWIKDSQPTRRVNSPCFLRELQSTGGAGTGLPPGEASLDVAQKPESKWKNY